MPMTAPLFATTPDPATAEIRFEELSKNALAMQNFARLSEPVQADFLHLISYSSFIYHLFCRQPELITQLGQAVSFQANAMADISDFIALREYKYVQLLRISWMDISNRYDYEVILGALSQLADVIVHHAVSLSVAPQHVGQVKQSMAAFALGKLGANELNFSSDIDLIFTADNYTGSSAQRLETQHILTEFVRSFSHHLEQNTEQGFLYRVDLKLRPWGASGPLLMSIDETESYYESSSEPWERLAWLRARCITGNKDLGQDLLTRLRPFIFMRSLSTEDLERFLLIKAEMSASRKRRGQWQVKTGAGGIRDIEFFIQILQLVNAATHVQLQQTNTLLALQALKNTRLIQAEMADEIRSSYLFLRRLENRLQMRDERQTHALPDENKQRQIIARSLGNGTADSDQLIDNFETSLFASQYAAKQAFAQILPRDEG